MSGDVSLELTSEAIARMRDAPNARLGEIMSVVIRHLHAAVREAELTPAEWEAAISFLTRTGHMCTGERQEFILLSDVLGVSMLVDALDHESTVATPSTVFGPFYSGRQPVLPNGSSILKRPEPGGDLLVEGHILDPSGSPITGALVEIWQTAPNGLYDMQDPDQPRGHLRGSLQSNAAGEYAFRTVPPVSYPIPQDGPVGELLRGVGRHPNRPAHIHFKVGAPGRRPLVTHLFVAGDPWLESDAVFGVKEALVVEPIQLGPDAWQIQYDFVLHDPD